MKKTGNTEETFSESEASTMDIALIYEQHQAQLKGFIARRVSFQEDVEDILQNVFLKLSRIDLRASPIDQITSWLYTVTRNQIIDRSRKKKEERMPQIRSQDPDNEFLGDLSDLLSDHEDTPESCYLNALVWKELQEALGELPREQRTVFELTELQGISFKEICKSTGLPMGTLLSRKRYAVLYLRERLKGLYEEIKTR